MSTSDPAAWPAPTAAHAVSASVAIPGSKSLTNRLLVLAAICGSTTTIRRPLHARDTMLMASALRSLGVGGADVEDPDPTVSVRGWEVIPQPLMGPATIDCGLAGTVMRFVPPLAALADGPVAFDGDPRARERPMGPILGALRELGVRVDTRTPGDDRLPFAILGTGRVAGGRIALDASASSQFVSALLLVGSRFADGLEIASTTPVPSLPHVRMTIDLLRRAGLEAQQVSDRSWHVAAGTPHLGDITVEPDLSNAMPFVAAALATGGSVAIEGWPAQSLQPADEVLHLIEQVGGTIVRGDTSLTVSSTGQINGGTFDMSAVGELVPTVAALAAFAEQPVTITGVAHLRGHETDRLAALVSELTLLGGDARETADGLTIKPRPLHAGLWHSYHDHRMATAGAIIGLRVPGVEVENIATTDKTLPGFVDLWERAVSVDGQVARG